MMDTPGTNTMHACDGLLLLYRYILTAVILSIVYVPFNQIF